jgi:anaerobic ribonucleoside-triphosphate reductase activating protein
MNYHQFEIALQEVPGEISLCFSITGCEIKCKGCHSPFLCKKENGSLLTIKKFKKYLNQYQGFATCILFMGGEWHEEKLENMAKYSTDLIAF